MASKSSASSNLSSLKEDSHPAQSTDLGNSPPSSFSTSSLLRLTNHPNTKRLSPKHKFGGNRNHIRSFVFLHDNVHFVSCSWGGAMCKWDYDTGLLVGEPWRGKTIACAIEDGSIQQWGADREMIEGIWNGRGRVRSLS
ncbi:hypothetical protein K503DRAFT_446925 [Rhizopogon vinicolor AM-OR11-026]|uniref:WD40 repeat-like protein n=1 Tax=Rhizopogon vinicolor AM-OR11-026 TaxID=1314800 RepID=A0A1B7NH95_9AGAM|nr:hypothetical protein K503DRAFT_446925 [Rhizopogon vinicolor AM-OR11-026]